MKTSIRKEQGGIPTGGSTGEALEKVSNADYDVDYAPVVGSGNKVSIDTTQKTSGGSYTIAIPGGLLGTNNAIRFRVVTSQLNFGGGGGNVTVDATYGGSAVGAQMILDNSSTSVTMKGAIIEGWIIASGATNSQKGILTMSSLQSLTTTTGFDNDASTLAIDSTISNNLVVTFGSSNGSITAEAIIVEIIA